MKWETLENKIKSALYGHKSEVDIDALWAAIEPGVDAINRKKKRRGFIWFWFFGALVVGVGFGFYFYQNGKASLQGKAQTASYVPQDDIESKMQDDEINLAQSKKEISTEISTGEPVNTGISTAEETNLKNLNRKPISKPIRHNSPKKSGELNSTSAIEKTNNNAAIIAAKHTAEEDMAGKEILSIESKDNAKNTLELGAKVQDMTALPTLALNFLDLPFSDISVKESLAAEPSLLPSKRRNDWSLAANLQGSISFVQRDLALKDSFSFDLLNSRKRTERELEAYQVGLGFTLQHRTGFNFSTGLNYTQINERFQFNEMVEKVDTVYDIKYLVINLNNDTVAIYGDVPFETKTTFQKEYYNKYRMIDVPLLLGYRHEGHEFSVGAQVGVFANISLKTEGQFLKSINETTNIDTAGIFKSNIGLSYYFGLYAGYKINEKLEVYASPFMRHFPKDFTKDSYAIRQRYNLYGLNIGLRYEF